MIRHKAVEPFIPFLCLLAVLSVVSTVNYLLFHGIVEIAGIAVAFSIFITVWNARKNIDDAFFLIIGVSFLFVGSMDLLHTLAYKGMGVFPGSNADLPTQLWIAARYFQSGAFLVATLLIGKSITRDRKYDTLIIFGSCFGVCGLLLATIFPWGIFPQCYIEGSGLTPFKVASEYVISLILIISIVILWQKKDHFEENVWNLLIGAQIFLILGELSFTSYISVYGFMNMLGHLFRLVSVYLFYRAFVVISLTRPYDLLFHELILEEKALRERDDLLSRTSQISRIGGWELDAVTGAVKWTKPVYFSPDIPAAQDISLEEVIDLFHPDDREKMRQAIERALSAGESSDIGLRMITASGNLQWVRTVCQPRITGDKTTHLVGFFQDITDLKAAEEALRESERKYRTLFENMLEGFAYCEMIYDGDGRPTDWIYRDVNKAFERLTGLKDVIGKRVLEVIPDINELTPELFDRYGRVASQGEPDEFEIYFTPLRIWLKVSVFSPQHGFFVAVFWDISISKKAENALRETKEYLEKLIGYANAPIIVWNPGFEITEFNHAFELLTGLNRRDVIGQPLSVLFPVESREQSLGRIRRTLAGEQWETVEIPVRHVSGNIRTVLWNSANVTDQSGRIIATIAQGQDITDRKLVEQVLRESEEKFRAIFDSQLNGILIIDPESHRIVDANPYVCDLIGLAKQEIVGKVCHTFVCTAELGKCPITDLGQHVDHSERVLVGAGGRTIPVLKTVNRISFGDRRYLIENIQDISTRKKAEDALRETKEYLEKLIGYANAPIIVWNPRFKITEFNHAFELLTGLDRRDIIGQPLSVLFPAESREQSLDRIRETLAGERLETVEIPIYHVSGNIRTVLWNSANILDSHGSVVATIAQGQDITDRKRATEALSIVNQKLNLLSSITRHDINNQLLTLMAYLELSKEFLGDTTKMSEYIIKEERAANAISRQIAFTKEYQDLGIKTPAWQSVETCVKKSVMALPMRDIQVQADVSGLEVYADPLFERVFYNLIDNALRYGGPGMTCITISSRSSGEGMVITVEDDGAGIPAENKSRVFERGFGTNTGLGLYLSREILAITGMAISEEGEMGKGATFRILIPKGGYRVPATP